MSTLHFDLPEELTKLSQWLVWRYVQKEGDVKPAKVPHTCMGYRADVTNREAWSNYQYALTTFREQRVCCDGMGFVFAADGVHCGIDLDHVWQSDADEGAPWAHQILERFADTYSEESPSGSGVKIWSRARLTPGVRCKWPIGCGGGLEIYDRGRFFTVTGRAGLSIPRAIADHQADVDSLVAYMNEGMVRGYSITTPGNSSRDSAINEVIPQGQRHNQLVSLAGTMWRRGMHSDAVEAALVAVNQRQCEPPLAARDIYEIVRSMSRWSR
jgi:hypothetical protein